jgi:hypothetical protein
LALAALVPWNVLAFGVRLTGARAGLEHGLEVAGELGRSWIRTAPARLRRLGSLGIGLGAGLALSVALRREAVGSSVAPGAPPGASAWMVLAVFALAIPLFALWPRRWGWGFALLGAWAVLAALTA